MEVDVTVEGVHRQWEHADGRVVYLHPTIMGGATLGIFVPKVLHYGPCATCGAPEWQHNGLARLGKEGDLECEYEAPRSKPDGMFFDEEYMFERYERAERAAEEWISDGEPVGWVRHKPSNRRRKYVGDVLVEEWVAE